jgi:LCP family protein required for cell wall assembly
MGRGSIYESNSRRPKHGRKVAIAAAIALLVVLGAIGFGGWFYLHGVDSKVNRLTVAALAEQPQTATGVAAGSMNILLLGSDTRNPDTTGTSRMDTIIVAHVTADHKAVQLVSIPRDTWLPIQHNAGIEHAKINIAYSLGGADLMVRTVQDFTKIKLDHVMLIDFAGFKEIIDALGGVDIPVDTTFTSIHGQHRTFTQNAPGTNTHMDGAMALDYSRQRKQFADGDFTRIAHQHQIIKAVMDKASSTGTITDPGRLNGFLNATAKSITVDSTMSPINFAWALHGVRSSDITFLTNPTGGTPIVEGESVVMPDPEKSAQLWQAVGADTVTQWAAANPQYVR